MNVEKFKFHLISDDPNDVELIKIFKTMNNALLLIGFDGEKLFIIIKIIKKTI